MTLTDYMTFMISRETENVSSIDDVVLAFKSLTENSERPYITRDELFAVSFVEEFDRRKKNRSLCIEFTNRTSGILLS